MRDPLLGGDHTRNVEDASDLGCEVPAAGEDLGRRPVGDDDPVAEQHNPLGEGGGELDVVGGDDYASPGASEPLDQLLKIVLASSVHAPRWLVERNQPRQLLPL